MTLRRAVVALAVSALCLPAWSTPVTVSIVPQAGVSPEGTVVVFDPKDAVPPPAHNTATIDQVNRQFVPRVTVVRTGTSIKFPNSDNVRHQVYSFSAAKTFTLKLYSGQPSDPVVFDKPGLVVLGCNIHDRMSGFVGIVDTPYFGKASAAGTFGIDLPPGHYRVRIWHPSLSAPVAAQDVHVQDAALAFKVPVSIDMSASAPAAWPE